MSDLQVFQMDNNGAGWVSFDSLPFADKVELQLALDTNAPSQLLCVVCLVPIPSGLGHCYCDKHKKGN